MKTTPLEERTGKEIYDEVMAYLERSAAKAEKERLPEPHPFDFSLSTQEETTEKLNAVHHHNAIRNTQASVYRDVAYVMEYSYIIKPQNALDQADLNRFGQGI